MGSAISSILTCNFSGGGGDSGGESVMRLENRVNDLTTKYGNNENQMNNTIRRLEDKIDMKFEIVNMKMETMISRLSK